MLPAATPVTPVTPGQAAGSRAPFLPHGGGDDAATHRALAAKSRRQLMDLIYSAGAITVSEGAHACGLHTNTARVHLERLAEAGLVERSTARRSGPGRPRTLYAPSARVAQRSQSSSDTAYRDLAAALAAELATRPDARELADEAGQRWLEISGGAALSPVAEPVSAVVELLDDLGFAPALRPDRSAIDLHRCPFAEVARENRTVVCGVHQGLLRKAFARLGDEGAMEGLEPFQEDQPLRCVVRLAARAIIGEPLPPASSSADAHMMRSDDAASSAPSGRARPVRAATLSRKAPR